MFITEKTFNPDNSIIISHLIKIIGEKKMEKTFCKTKKCKNKKRKKEKKIKNKG